jgi:hypothetical protein
VEWRQINLNISCDGPAAVNQLRTTTFDGSRWISAPVSSRLLRKNISWDMFPRWSQNDDGRSPWTWDGPRYWSWSIYGTGRSSYSPSAEMQSTTTSRTNDNSIILIVRIKYGKRRRRRRGDIWTILCCWEGTRRWWCFADMATRTLPSCGRSCNVVSTQSRHSRATRMDLRSQTGLILLIKFIPNKVSRDTAKMTTRGSQRGKRVKMLVFGAPTVW